jgi:hypothetical protein
MSLELSRGRMGLSVARQVMGTGEPVDVHTPNAVASMRGSVAIVGARPTRRRTAWRSQGRPKGSPPRVEH